MRREENETSSASLSFLDVIACAFGAIVLLVLILPIGQWGLLGDDAELNLRFDSLKIESDQLDAAIKSIEQELAEVQALLAQVNSEVKGAASKNQRMVDSTKKLRDEAAKLRARKSIVEQTRSEVLKQDPNATLSTEYSGLPVDAEYVAFIIDTSGSMKSIHIWSRVMREVNAILNVYPTVKGFQILNDQGNYLFRSYERRWIPDTPTLRNLAQDRLADWRSFSQSDPAKGIYEAIDHLYRNDIRMAIFVFGDDYSRSDFGDFLDSIDQVVGSRKVTEGTLRIHGVGFRNFMGTGSQLNFATLMRELSMRYNGAFLAMP